VLEVSIFAVEVKIGGHPDSHAKKHPCAVVFISFDWTSP
jgi:hypothetical protein